MSLGDRLLEDMKEAMKQKKAGKIRLSTIRMVRAAQKEAEIDLKRELSDNEIIDIISREVKKRKDVVPDYEKANRPETVKQLHEEIKILQGYLPEQLAENEIREIIGDAIEKIGATSSRDMGRVMKKVMPGLKGWAEGNLVNQLVKQMLK